MLLLRRKHYDSQYELERKFVNNSGSVLVIEDNVEMQDLLGLLLKHGGYSMKSTAMGKEALNMLRSSQDFSLILLDMNLADMNAQLFLEQKNAEGLGKNIPILFCSASPDIQQMQLPTGVVGVISKPFQIKQLLGTVEKFIRPPKLGLELPEVELKVGQFNKLLH